MGDQEERIICPGLEREDLDIENSLRPKKLEDYVGQDKIKDNLKMSYMLQSDALLPPIRFAAHQKSFSRRPYVRGFFH